ncbi:hypothetical protein [Teichococcus vastitatis]|uniref:Uncharacterized protein n=1 Tax=Teichococcus vastitatis TaxID=2307076 RepID=A0ABS9W2X0_9PROT|nr:hypothetical protein [Pseudoroseomonas vastitatis]MCI0753521.1 hypothetical protein [Pseudoroseomonas vastitatis]
MDEESSCSAPIVSFTSDNSGIPCGSMEAPYSSSARDLLQGGTDLGRMDRQLSAHSRRLAALPKFSRADMMLSALLVEMDG